MDLARLPLLSPLALYEEQAALLLRGHASADPQAIKLIHERHPRFLDEKIRWLPKRISDTDIQNAPFDSGDARLALARWYDFADWDALATHVEAVTCEGSGVRIFEEAVEAVVDGQLDSLRAMLRSHQDLVHARSARVTHFDPPVHRSTLLHYVAANGVEGYRQRTPPNAVAIATALLEAGAEPDSLAGLYGGQCTTMTLLVSSCHPAAAGLQAALVDTLAGFGAAVEPRGEGKWASPLQTALAFGYIDAARALVRRGAKADRLNLAAGLGEAETAARLLPNSTAEERHSALALAAQLGHAEIVRLLLDAGEDPDRFNPEGHHAHSTPLHQAALSGHEAVVRLLAARGAKLDIEDKIWESTPAGWAAHSGHHDLAAFLEGQ